MTTSTHRPSVGYGVARDMGEAAVLWTPGPVVGTTAWTCRRLDVFGVIEVGAGRARLDVFRSGSDRILQAVWRDEEVIATPARRLEPVDERLIHGLRRFQRVCGRHHVTVGAVAHGSDALNNHPETLPRVFRMTGVPLKQVSDREAARLLCLGLLRGETLGRKTLVVDVGLEATQVILADGEAPVALWRLGVGTADSGEVPAGASSLRDLRAEVQRSLRQTRLDAIRGATTRALTGRDGLAGTGGNPAEHARTRAILEEIASYLRLDGIRAVDRGLREGILFDLCRAVGRAVA